MSGNNNRIKLNVNLLPLQCARPRSCPEFSNSMKTGRRSCSTTSLQCGRSRKSCMTPHGSGWSIFPASMPFFAHLYLSPLLAQRPLLRIGRNFRKEYSVPAPGFSWTELNFLTHPLVSSLASLSVTYFKSIPPCQSCLISGVARIRGGPPLRLPCFVTGVDELTLFRVFFHRMQSSVQGTSDSYSPVVSAKTSISGLGSLLNALVKALSIRSFSSAQNRY